MAGIRSDNSSPVSGDVPSSTTPLLAAPLAPTPRRPTYSTMASSYDDEDDAASSSWRGSETSSSAATALLLPDTAAKPAPQRADYVLGTTRPRPPLRSRSASVRRSHLAVLPDHARPRLRRTSLASSLAPSRRRTAPKLGTASGVFMPVFLSIWGILYFLRFGVIIGEAGILGTLGMLAGGYMITTLTTLSVSAISTNGRVRAGGPYFIISRCLGAEFGGSIGIVYFVGSILGNTMSAVGFVEPLLDNFDLPRDPWYQTGYAASLLVVSTLLSFLGSKMFSKLNVIAFILLNVSTASALFSFLWRGQPSWHFFYQNLYPSFDGEYGWTMMFSLIFPACAGILAGASMSGELKSPSQSIPRGTVLGIVVTGTMYVVSVLIIGFTVPRAQLKTDLSIMQSWSVVPVLYLAGVFCAAFYAVFGGIQGTSQLLFAILRDQLVPAVPALSAPTCIAITFFLTGLALLGVSNMNAIAPFFTTTTLLCYAIVNLACLLLRAAAAPNFRPSFRYFNKATAAAGMGVSVAAMMIVDIGYAAMCLLVSTSLFYLIHYGGEPKHWGDVSASLLYLQVRKMLLKLDAQPMSVKSWRPQLLLFCEHLEPLLGMIQFANDLKKGALFVIGHVVVGSLDEQLLPYKATVRKWTSTVKHMGVKAFVHVDVAPSVRVGAQSILLGAGLGAMKPNVVLLPLPPADTPSPDFLGILEDACGLDKAIGVLSGFDTVTPPTHDTIDLWPICLALTPSSTTAGPRSYPGTPARHASLLALPITSADDVSTFTLVLQLGYILASTDRWRHARIRLFLVVERHADMAPERRKLVQVLADLRMDGRCEVHGVCLADEMSSLGLDGADAVVAAAAAQLVDDAAWTTDPAMDDGDSAIRPASSVTITRASPAVLVPSSVDEPALDDDDDLPIEGTALERTRFPAPRALFGDVSPVLRPVALAADPATVVNRVVRKYSSQSGAVLSTLPPFALGTSRNPAATRAYVASVRRLAAGVPRMVLVQASSVTVTTAL
ncbi:hypothetical protein GGF32_005889 [Allomyces javanicus]|nr:hypothetical protein GGF32_005889 [Allomyces javanicus]